MNKWLIKVKFCSLIHAAFFLFHSLQVYTKFPLPRWIPRGSNKLADPIRSSFDFGLFMNEWMMIEILFPSPRFSAQWMFRFGVNDWILLRNNDFRSRLLKAFMSRLETRLKQIAFYTWSPLVETMWDDESESRLKTSTWTRLETRLTFAVLHRLNNRLSGIRCVFKSRLTGL